MKNQFQLSFTISVNLSISNDYNASLLDVLNCDQSV